MFVGHAREMCETRNRLAIELVPLTLSSQLELTGYTMSTPRMDQASPPPPSSDPSQSRNKRRRLSQVDEGNILDTRKRRRGEADEEVSHFLFDTRRHTRLHHMRAPQEPYELVNKRGKLSFSPTSNRLFSRSNCTLSYLTMIQRQLT